MFHYGTILRYIIVIIIIVIILVFLNRYYNTAPPLLEIKLDKRIKQLKTDSETILDTLKWCSQKFPKYTALKYKKNDWTDITYKQYYDKVVNFAESANEWLESGVNCGIIGTNSTGWFYAHLGTMMNNGISIGIHPTTPIKQCMKIIREHNIEILVTDDVEKFKDVEISPLKLIIYYAPQEEQLIKTFDIPVISMGNFMTKKRPLGKRHYNTTATIIYTSGTVEQKGIKITHRDIMNSLNNTVTFINKHSNIADYVNGKLVSYLPLNHIAAQMFDIYLPILTISTVWFADKHALTSSEKHPNGTLVNTLLACKPTIFVGVPRVWEKLMEGIVGRLSDTFTRLTTQSYKLIEGIGLNECRLCISTAAPISEFTRDYFESIGLHIYDAYGMSETTGLISMSLPTVNKLGSVGKPLIPIKIENDGEILVKMKNDWFHTGDIGNIDLDGYLFVTGRLKEIIITSGGENVSPLPLENKIKSFLSDIVEHVVVIGNKKKFLTALLILKQKKLSICRQK